MGGIDVLWIVRVSRVNQEYVSEDFNYSRLLGNTFSFIQCSTSH
jgi:hypothetical protein